MFCFIKNIDEVGFGIFKYIPCRFVHGVQKERMETETKQCLKVGEVGKLTGFGHHKSKEVFFSSN